MRRSKRTSSQPHSGRIRYPESASCSCSGRSTSCSPISRPTQFLPASSMRSRRASERCTGEARKMPTTPIDRRFSGGCRMPLVGDMVCTTLTLGCVGPLGLLPDGNHGQGRVYDGELRPEAAGRLQGVLHARSGETYRARGIAISSSQVRRPCRPGTGRALARRERDPGAAFERIPRRPFPAGPWATMQAGRTWLR